MAFDEFAVQFFYYFKSDNIRLNIGQGLKFERLGIDFLQGDNFDIVDFAALPEPTAIQHGFDKVADIVMVAVLWYILK